MANQNTLSTYAGKTFSFGEHLTSEKLGKALGDAGVLATEDVKKKFEQLDANSRNLFPLVFKFEDVSTPGTFIQQLGLPVLPKGGEIISVAASIEVSDATVITADVKKAGVTILSGPIDILTPVGDVVFDDSPSVTTFSSSAADRKWSCEIVVTSGTSSLNVTVIVWLKAQLLALAP